MIQVPPSASTFRPNSALLWVDPHALHIPQVESDSSFTRCKTCNTVTAAAYSQQEIVFFDKPYCCNNVCHTRSLYDQCRPVVVHSIVYFTRFFIWCIIRLDKFATKALFEFTNNP